MEKINDGGSAFPNEHYREPPQSGMTLRDYFAAKALPACYQGYVSHATIHGWDVGWKDGIATDAYAMADAMLKARMVKS